MEELGIEESVYHNVQLPQASGISLRSPAIPPIFGARWTSNFLPGELIV